MTRLTVPCKFRVGKHGVKSPVKELWKRADPEIFEIASGVLPGGAICNRCKYEMDKDELFNRDLKVLACPNCYSDNLSVTQVEFELGYLEYLNETNC